MNVGCTGRFACLGRPTYSQLGSRGAWGVLVICGCKLLREGTMKLPRRSFLRLAASAATLPIVSGVTRAQEWPSRPIRMVVPFAAGGPTDIVARVMGAKMGE